MTPPLSLLIKPAGSDCNLRCRYCFYRPADGPGRARLQRMSDAVLEATIAGFLALPQPLHAFCWQGGEPTLMGAGFYRRVTDLQQRHGRQGQVIANSLQTNLVAMDDDLAAHLAAYRFLVGCSLDGPADLHDRHRRDAAGAGSHARVLAGLAVLRRHGVPANALALVSRDSVGRAPDIMTHLLEQGLVHQQYIPCADVDRHGRPQPWALSGEAWGDFLCALFEAWEAGLQGVVTVRLFEAILARLVDDVAAICTMAPDCRQYLVVEHDGAVYPCDFHVGAPWRLGRLPDDRMADLAAGAAFAAFGARKSELPDACLDCPHRDLCAGDCPRLRAPVSRLCTGWRRFLDATRPRFEALAEVVRAGRLTSR